MMHEKNVEKLSLTFFYGSDSPILNENHKKVACVNNLVKIIITQINGLRSSLR